LKLLFVPNPHVRFDRTWAAPYVPYELLSAMAIAERCGAEAALFDVNRLVETGSLKVEREIWKKAAALLEEAEPDAVVFETWSGTMHHTLLLAREIRRRMPKLPLVLGGAGASGLTLEILSHFPAVDGVIRGDFEPAVEGLVRAGGGLPSAPGLARRTGAAIGAAEMAAVEEIDSLPRAAFHLGLLEAGDSIPLETGRGCAQGCTFCILAGQWVRRYRSRSPEAIAAEMRDLAAKHPRAPFDLTQDPVFFNDPDRLAQLCAALEGANLRWTCHARADRLGQPELEALARAGCRGILFGVESGCLEQQAALGKRIDLERVVPTVQAAVRLGIEVRASFVVGFPEEDRESLRRTFTLVQDVRRAGAADVSVQPLRAYPGSAIHARFRDALVFDPLLCTAAPGDEEGRGLIEAFPDLLPASYRVPSGLRREETLVAWLGLTALGTVVEALERHGQPAFEALMDAATDPLPDTLEAAVGELGERLLRLVGDAVESISLHDLLAYERAIFLVGRERVLDREPVDASILARCRSSPQAVVPHLAAPWRVVHVRTDVSRLVEVDLKPCPHEEREALLVAKVQEPGRAAYYTRRSFTIESFRIDPIAEEILGLCAGATDVRSIGLAVAARRRLEPGETVQSAIRTVSALAEAGVLWLEGP
jgi:hypothetical protein